MKNVFFLSVFSLTTYYSFGQTTVYDTIRYAKDYHESRLATFMKEPIVKGNIVFLGNSITEFGNWQQLLHDSSIVNRGIAGDNTFGVLARLDNVIAHQPSKLFLKIGINDISQNIPVDIIAKNIFTIIERVKAKSPSTQIYVHSVLPTNDNVKNEYPDAYNKNDKVVLLNKAVKQQAKGYTYIDLYTAFSGKDGKLNTQFADADGLHLNDMGYKTWVAFLKGKKYL